MAAIQALTSNLILHPQITRTLKLLSTTIGRDKTYRLIQYLARLVAWSVLRAGGEGAKQSAMRWDGLKSGLASGRKMLRLVKPLEHLQSAVNTASITLPSSNLSPLASQTAQLTQIARQISYAGYLGTDMLVWLQSVKFLRLDKDRLARITLLSQRLWLSGITFSLISTLSSLIRLRSEGRRFSLSSSAQSSSSTSSSIGFSEKDSNYPTQENQRQIATKMLKERESLLSQLVTDSLDFWIPATNLGYARLNDGQLGAIGVITSWTALQAQWLKAGAAGK